MPFGISNGTAECRLCMACSCEFCTLAIGHYANRCNCRYLVRYFLYIRIANISN